MRGGRSRPTMFATDGKIEYFTHCSGLHVGPGCATRPLTPATGLLIPMLPAGMR